MVDGRDLVPMPLEAPMASRLVGVNDWSEDATDHPVILNESFLERSILKEFTLLSSHDKPSSNDDSESLVVHDM